VQPEAGAGRRNCLGSHSDTRQASSRR
jgi:hypothetical protein